MCDRAIMIKKGEVISFMDFHNNMKKQQITFVIESLDTVMTRKILKNHGYEVVGFNEHEVRVKIGAKEKTDVARLLASKNVVMTGLYEACETLEDTFLELMRA